MADELVNGTQGHENESVNVAGLKATIKDAGNLGIFNKGVCSTAAGTAAKTVTVGSAFALEEDALVLVRFANEVTSENSTLSVNNSTAKPIYYHGDALEPNVIKADSEYIMRYDGSYWCIIGGMADREIEVEIGETSPVEDVKLFVDEDEDPASAIDIYNKTQVDTLLGGKVDKETGKGLSTNDYTTNEKNKLSVIPSTSEAAESGGTDLSLVTTGEKHNWNNMLPLSGGTMNGGLFINNGQFFSKESITLGSAIDNTYCLDMCYINNVPSIQAVKQMVGFDFNFALAPNGGNVGVGTTSVSYKLHVAGDVGATAYNNTSDIRKKDIIENFELDVEDIANAPLFKFSWLDPEMPEGVNVGTSAQYWQTILPEIVSGANDDEKTLSMQYGVAGLASSIALARKVVEQENTIKAQEARIKALENVIAEIQNKLK